MTLPFKSRDEILIDVDGIIKEGFLPRRYQCPLDISSLLEQVESELVSKVDRFLKLLRWRQGINTPSEIIGVRTLVWRVAGEKYWDAPPDINPLHETEAYIGYGIQWEDEHSTAIQELWSMEGIVEPLGHALVREASALSSESPRSSILIMTAALETAVKMHISRIAPDTAWIMEEIQSPPIDKILRDYIPKIHRERKNEIAFWDKVKPFISKAKKLIEIRNKIAHTGKIPKDAGHIRDNLVLVSDLLYLLDVLDGFDWAKCHTSDEFRKALGWPSPTKGKIRITFSHPY